MPPDPRPLPRRALLQAGLVLPALAAGSAACSTDDGGGAAGDGSGDGDGAADGAQPEPVVDGWLVTRWGADPWALGSYSFLRPGATPEDRRSLQVPQGRLLLAGEATSVEHPGTVHGALLSGRRAAAQVAELVEPGATVAVVGAGAAGLGCAAALRATHRVVVLEARDRLGGRVWTDRSLGFPVELGAGWIHGPDGNPLVPLADAAGVATASMADATVATADAAGDPVDTTTAATDATTVLDRARVLGEARDDDVDLRTLVDAAFDDLGLDPDRRAGVERVLATEVGHEFAADPEELSGWWWDEGAPFTGDDLLVTGGYDSILAPLADGVDVRLATPVRRIDHDDAGVRLIVDGGSVDAAAAVVTLPVGVLAAGSMAFAPALPAAWTVPLGRIGSGLLDKVVLRAPTPWWGDDWWLQWWGPELGELPEWVNLVPATGHPAVVAFSAASAARRLEGRPEAAVAERATEVLRAMTGLA